jgi:hypothetical protein
MSPEPTANGMNDMSLLNLIVEGTKPADAAQLIAADKLIHSMAAGYHELLRMDVNSPTQVANLREYARALLADVSDAA